jgi:hypothetical protein
MSIAPASFSPVSLSYIAALRGFKPRRPGEAFTYAFVNCSSPEFLIGLAASNPEGQFYGLVGDADVATKAARQAAERQVGNVAFLAAKPAGLLKDISALPALDYLACDESRQGLTHLERTALFDLAAQKLKAGGLFNYNYRAFDDAGDVLRFLVREFAPEMNERQAIEFLTELKKIGSLYLKSHADIAAKLDQAIAKNMPDEFFALFDAGEACSATFDTLVAQRTRGMVYAGAGQIRNNYVELSIPAEAQDIVIECRDNPLCESIKDFSSLHAIRSDIWCKEPAARSADPAELLGGFAYGVIAPEEDVPFSVEVYGKTVDLSGPIYRKLIGLMAMQPAGIGDFLQHPDGKGFTASEAVASVQILVALGIARPMRGARESGNVSSVAQPRFSGSFNRYIDRMAVTGESMDMASKVMGDVISVPPREVLVMQALNRAGLANSVSALLPELERLAKDPAFSASIADRIEPTSESAYQMINDVVSRSIVHWYAYGLLEAA